MASPVLLWRVLTNVVDNAARAAGPSGRVEVAVGCWPSRHRGRVLEVLDNGPGFGHGPPGAASLGLGVVTTLLESCGGSWRSSARGGRRARPDRDPGAASRRRPGRNGQVAHDRTSHRG